jgi:hypothetical protein
MMLLSLFIALLQPNTQGLPHDAARCSEPAFRSQILGNGGDDLPLLDQMRARTEANEARTDALMKRFTERVKMSDEEGMAFTQGMMNAPGFEEHLRRNLDLMKVMFGKVDVIMKSKDEAAKCRAGLEMMNLLSQIEANADAQWDIIRGNIEAEAKKRGISLEP